MFASLCGIGTTVLFPAASHPDLRCSQESIEPSPRETEQPAETRGFSIAEMIGDGKKCHFLWLPGFPATLFGAKEIWLLATRCCAVAPPHCSSVTTRHPTHSLAADFPFHLTRGRRRVCHSNRRLENIQADYLDFFFIGGLFSSLHGGSQDAAALHRLVKCERLSSTLQPPSDGCGRRRVAAGGWDIMLSCF